MKGIIPGNSSVEIDIEFSPTDPVTRVLDVELNVSQYGFKPLKISIKGSGQYKEIVNDRKEQELKTMKQLEVDRKDKASKYAFRLKKYKTVNKQRFVLDASRKFKRNESMEVAPDREDLEANEEEEFKSKKDKATGKPAPSKKGKQELENIFAERFQEIVELCKNKEIKMIESIGDPEPTSDDLNAIKQERQNFDKDRKEDIRVEGVERYEKVLDSDLPILEPILPYYPATWDINKNNANKLRKMRLKKFINVATKIVLRIRVDKRINRIQNLKELLRGTMTKQEVNKIVADDWQKADYLGVGKLDFVRFDFQFNEVNIDNNRLAIQYDNKIDQITETYNASPTIGFDDLSQINELKYNDAEVLEYKPMDAFIIHLYPPVMISEIYRTGAEEEYNFRGQLGPYGVLNQNEEEMVIFIEIPARLLLDCSNQSYKIIYPQESLKALRQLADVTEVDAEYMLRWEKVDYFTMLRSKVHTREELANLTHELIASTPGYDSLRVLNKLQVEQSRYWDHSTNLAPDVFKEREIEGHCPEIIYNVDKDDLKSDEDSDDDNEEEFKLGIASEDEFNVEKFDPNFDERMKQYYEDLTDDKENLINNLLKNFEKEKLKNLSLMTTMTSDYNKYIKYPSNKLFII